MNSYHGDTETRRESRGYECFAGDAPPERDVPLTAERSLQSTGAQLISVTPCLRTPCLRGDVVPLRRAEAVVLASAAALVGLGLVMIYSTSGVLAERYGSATFFLEKQAAWAVVAAAALVVGRRIDYHLYARLRRPVMFVTFVALVMVLVPGVGTKLNGARRWFRFGGVGFQPSDAAKIAVVVYLAGFLDERRSSMGDWRRGFLPPAGALACIVGLIALEPDVGTAALVAAVGGTLLLAGGARMRHLVPAALLAVPPVAFYVLVRLEYVRARLISFLDPSADPLGAGYHARQSLIALASGGVFGKGLGRGSQKLFFLPEAHTDFILAIVGEELGVAGALAVVAAFAAIVASALVIARRAPDRTGALVASGLALWIGLQAALNVAVVTASVPPKGIPLPLVSYGGSSLVATAFALGMLLNVGRHGRAASTALVTPRHNAGEWGALPEGDRRWLDHVA